MGQRIVQVDAFASAPFTGNPAAVCVLGEPAPEAWMRDVAREMNLSETAFLWREDDVWRLRWFTPAVEVDLCGHATLASAHVLWEDGHLAADETARFETRSGRLRADRRGEWIRLDFPALPPKPADAPEGLIEALGVEPVQVVRSRDDYLVEVGTAAEVRAAKPDLNRLLAVRTRGVILTARSDEAAYHFVSRFFGPAVGVPEDPVTGSAHCALAPYWSERLGLREMVGFQASARGGEVRVEVAGERVIIGGRAITVLRGELL